MDIPRSRFFPGSRSSGRAPGLRAAGPAALVVLALGLALGLGLVTATAVPAIAAEPPPAEPPAGASVSEAGVASVVVEPGGSDSDSDAAAAAEPNDDAWVRFSGTVWEADGTVRSSSTEAGGPWTVDRSRLAPGLAEALATMVPGETRRLWIPRELGAGIGEEEPAGDLRAEVTLVGVLDPLPPPPDVAAPPTDAERTESGVASKVLEPGHGESHPTTDDLIRVHYTGWTTDGKMFDSSVARGKPTSFPLKRVIAGWTEGLQLMVEGEKTRFWIPVELAYKNQPGKPAGMLVFDVELLKIVK